MAGKLNKLSGIAVKNAGPGKYEDGGGLRLVVSESGAKRWVFRFTWKGHRVEMGLGGINEVSLAEAREAAAEARKLVRAGVNPVEQRRAAGRRQGGTPTFSEAAEAFMAAKAPEWRSPVHARQWRQTIRDYCGPIAAKPIDQITPDDVLGVIGPLWLRATKTAGDLCGRIDAVWSAAQAKGHIPMDKAGPASWALLRHHLPKRQKIAPTRHHPAVAHSDMPAFFNNLRQRESVASYALQLIVLTGVRLTEALEATWDEIDVDAALWVIPARRMKAGREHRIPLSHAALAIVEGMTILRRDDRLLFPGRRFGRPVSGPALHRVMAAAGAGEYTIHGFRSTLRDWVGDETKFPREVAEAALAHAVGDTVESAYRRGDALEKRRQLMQAWADYVVGPVQLPLSTPFSRAPLPPVTRSPSSKSGRAEVTEVVTEAKSLGHLAPSVNCAAENVIHLRRRK